MTYGVSGWWTARADQIAAEFQQCIEADYLDAKVLWDAGLFTENPTAALRHRRELAARFGDRWVDDWLVDGLHERTRLAHLHFVTVVCDTPQRPGLVVEWGGGFGQAAEIGARWTGATWCVVDLPEMMAVQERFLADRRIPCAMWDGAKVDRASGAVWLVPLPQVGRFGHTNCRDGVDLFASRFGLSESPRDAWEWVASSEWFGANHAAMLMQPSSSLHPDNAALFDRLVADPRWTVGPSSFPPAVRATYNRLP